MTVIVETGAGILDANAYGDRAFVTLYLTDRGRETDWVALSDPQQDAFVVAATDYIEKRWSQRVKGTREFSFSDVNAVGAILFTGVPSAAETLAIEDFVYTFVAALSGDEPLGNSFEVLIGADAAASALNLLDALTADADTEGTTHDSTVVNRHVTAELDDTVLEQVNLTAAAPGANGDFTTLVGPVTNVTLTPIAGGIDGGSQPLSFPQRGLFDRAGVRVDGIPLRLKQCMAEYSDRVRVAILDPDPTFDAQGGSITSLREKVGPIEVSTQYSDGTHGRVTIRPYPAADRLMDEYVFPAGQVVR